MNKHFDFMFGESSEPKEASNTPSIATDFDFKYVLVNKALMNWKYLY
jgi:hypothetical protein